MVRVNTQLRRSIMNHPRLVKTLLIGGIASSLLYVATDVLGILRYPGYSFISRSPSDLSAIDAPTRSLVVPLNITADAVMIGFGIGVWALAGRRRALRATAILLAGNAAITMVVSVFFPVHPEEPTSALPNVLNTTLMATGLFMFLFAIGLGAAIFRNWFRLYSIGTLSAYAVLTFVGLWVIPQTTSGKERSLIEAQERTMMYSYLQWIALLAIMLLREQRTPSPLRSSSRFLMIRRSRSTHPTLPT